MSSADDFDLLASSLRADTADLGAFMETLAVKLEDALPSETQVERKRAGLLSGGKVVQRIGVELGDWHYELVMASAGRLEGRRAHAVRGISISTEELGVDAWIEALARDLTDQAAASAQARSALERLLL